MNCERCGKPATKREFTVLCSSIYLDYCIYCGVLLKIQKEAENATVS